MSRIVRGGIVAVSIVLAGCSETGFQDVFDSGKFSPDETKVRANQPLTTPPDLQLRPPSGAGAPPPGQVVTNQPPVNTAPPQYTTQAPAYQPQQPAYTAPQQTQPVYTPPTQQAAVLQQQPAVSNDPYVRYGISKTRPDGTPKTQGELIEELRRKKLAREKAKNPNYGTIFNMGSIWKDG